MSDSSTQHGRASVGPQPADCTRRGGGGARGAMRAVRSALSRRLGVARDTLTEVRCRWDRSLVFLEDRRTYRDYAHYERRFDWTRPAAAGTRLSFHCWWSGALTAHHELSLKSLLTTQSGPLDVRLWTPQGEGRTAERALCAFGCAGAVRVEELDFEREAEGTPFEGRAHLLTRGSATAVSDNVRTLVLAKHGGVYFDLDVLFLRDLRPLCGAELCYPWSDRPYGNSAVLHLFAGSPNASSLAERGVRLGTCHPRRLLRFRELAGVTRDLHVLPVFAFDPAWIARDRKIAITSYCNDFDDFFAAGADVPLRDFFPSSYTYHWHNRWNVALRPDSLAGRFYETVRARFRSVTETPVEPAPRSSKA